MNNELLNHWSRTIDQKIENKNRINLVIELSS